MWVGFLLGFQMHQQNIWVLVYLGAFQDQIVGGWCLGTLEEVTVPVQCEQFSDLCIINIIEKVVPEEHFSSSELSGQFGTESHTNSELIQWPSWQQKYPGSSTSGWRFNFLKVILILILQNIMKWWLSCTEIFHFYILQPQQTAKDLLL